MRRPAARRGRHDGARSRRPIESAAHFGAQLLQFVLVRGAGREIALPAVHEPESEERGRRGDDGGGENNPTRDHWYSKFGNCPAEAATPRRRTALRSRTNAGALSLGKR